MLSTLFSVLFFGAWGQKTIDPSHYENANSFLYENVHNKKIFSAHVKPHWFEDSTGVWFIEHTPTGKQYFQVNYADMQKKPLFDHERIAQALSEILSEEVSAAALPIEDLKVRQSEQYELTAKGQPYTLHLEGYQLDTLKPKKAESEQGISPDGVWKAYTKDYNLHIRKTGTDTTYQLSKDGRRWYEYGTYYGWYDLMEGEDGERPEHFWVEWSEDNQWLYTNACDMRQAEKMYLLDWSIDSLYRPQLRSYFRGSPGDTTMVYMEPVFYHVSSGKEVRPNLPRATHINTIDMRWSKTPEVVYLDRLSRGFQHQYIYRFDLNTETLDTLYHEESTTNIDGFTYQLAEEAGLLFFLSEKDGWRQLYSLQLNNKKEKRLTKGEFYIHSIEKIDQEKKKIYFLAAGKEKGSNPYHQRLYSISFSGKNLQLLTPENTHHRIDLSPEGQYFVDNYSTVNTPTKTVLRDLKNGKVIGQLSEAFLHQAGGWKGPEVFTATARDGQTTIYGALWKPTDFDPSQSYPILEYTYTGPHTQLFPKDFNSAYWLQCYAELGFVVLVVDGLGSSGRSKAFHNYSYKNLGGNLEDHILAIRQLGEQYSWLDTTRVGIFGHSAGGYDAAHALLAYPDFYKVAVSSSADHDHRMEKAWWPEMYMGWPVDSAYHEQSNVTLAAQGSLKGKLLLVHGGMDENVNPSATFKLAEALIKADRPFDMLILPSQHHGYQGAYWKYFRKVRWNYFIEHLKGEVPLWDIEKTN
ncbi:S9 family peptidase [Algivirga pacifica]|uniref:S9 family peptidase n=2 Tax=Algivirga pacifica TaxID=1162670 RepID=A0ABP9DCI6_9BACT